MNSSIQHKEPLIHITKRADMSRGAAWGIRIGSIVCAILLCAVVTTAATGLDPGSVFETMLQGAFGSERKMWILGKELAILLLISLALTPAYKMRFWNLGGEGQVMIGALATAACMIYLGNTLPNGLLILVMLIAAVAAGAVWAVIPAFFKARWNTNETLFTLMMNYVAIQLVAYFIIIWEVPKGSGKVGIINGDTMAGWLPVIADYRYLLTILVAVAFTINMHLYLTRGKHGYEIAVVGESPETARYVGIKVSHVIIRTLIMSGGMCGMVGWLMVAGSDHTITTTLAGGRGFLGIMVAWLAQFNAFAMVAATFLLVFMSRGAVQISSSFGLNESFGDILTGIILFCIIGSEFFINYQIHFRTGGKKAKEVKKDA